MFTVTVTTQDSHFILEQVRGPPRERQTSSEGEVLDLENFRLSLQHGRPSQQVLSSWRNTSTKQLRRPTDSQISNTGLTRVIQAVSTAKYVLRIGILFNFETPGQQTAKITKKFLLKYSSVHTSPCVNVRVVVDYVILLYINCHTFSLITSYCFRKLCYLLCVFASVFMHCTIIACYGRPM